MTQATAGRLFIATSIPSAARAALTAHLVHHARTGLPGRVVQADNWHWTLRFLGQTSVTVRTAMEETISRAALGPQFTIRYGTLGAFPTPDRARVLWLGVTRGAVDLAALAEAVEAAVVAAGVEPARRPFTGHLTLSRLREPRDVRALLDEMPPCAVEHVIDSVDLMRSHLGHGPPRYQSLVTWPLEQPVA